MHRMFRASTAAPLVAILLATSLSGCHWFKKKNELYTQSGESRPLEVPPDLDRPAADRAMALPTVGSSVTASGAQAARQRCRHPSPPGPSVTSVDGTGLPAPRQAGRSRQLIQPKGESP